jgi:L-ascorbate metabolism protein UlaG (beta-lactamase superfamily)
VKEPYLADDAFLADVEAVRGEPGVHVWWLGQSGFLIGCEGRHLLVDPYLSDSLTVKYEGTETPHVRMTRRVVAPERLSFVDLVLSTHGHTDHLDGETLRAVGAPLVCPAGIVELARERSGAEIIGLSEGETADAAGARIEPVPAVHPGDHCVGYVLTVGGRRIYHSGDTAWVDPGVRAVDLALLPVNGKLGNLDGREAARLASQVEAGLAVPCHYDMFEFNTASPDEFVAECERLGQGCRVLRQGERLALSSADGSRLAPA